MADPLSFLAGEDTSSSDSEVDNGNEQLTEDVSERDSDANKLPPPDSLFATVGKPSFLYDPTAGSVDWDKLVKNETIEAENVHTSDSHYAAIAPPSDTGQEYGSKHNKKVHSSLTAAIVNTYSSTSGEISAPPMRYSTKDVDPKFRTVSDGPESLEDQTVVGKRDLSSSSGTGTGDAEPSASKKQKVQNFRQKEKRKRDEGQSSRGKSYVEEEKRILRQNFATDEVLS